MNTAPTDYAALPVDYTKTVVTKGKDGVRLLTLYEVDKDLMVGTGGDEECAIRANERFIVLAPLFKSDRGKGLLVMPMQFPVVAGRNTLADGSPLVLDDHPVTKLKVVPPPARRGFLSQRAPARVYLG